MLSDYLRAENADGSSGAGLWHSSSVGAVFSTGHNSDSSQAQFGGGACYFGDDELVEPMEGEGSMAVASNLLSGGMAICVLDEPYSDNDKDLFSSSEGG